MTDIFTPYFFASTDKKVLNRIGLAPMTNTQSYEDGTLSEEEFLWLKKRAEGGFGLILTCASHVSENGKAWNGQMGIWHDKHISGLSNLTQALKKEGALSCIQLFHGGARCPQSILGSIPVSASENSTVLHGKVLPSRALHNDEIESIIDDFVMAAKRALSAGFDAIELHGAHGYLLHQFLSAKTNLRSDKWGGDYNGRSRLLLEIVRRIKHELGNSLLLGVRLSPEDKYTFEGIAFEEALRLAVDLESEGVNFIDVSSWDALKKPEAHLEGEKLLITYFKEILQQETALMIAGEIWDREEAEKAIQAGADFVLLGRAAIGHADWPKQAKSPNYQAPRPPFSREHLKCAGLSNTFIDYMKKWKGFVSE